MRTSIAIRTDGSQSLGNGHIVRMMALADELRSRKIDFLFLIKNDAFWIERIGKQHRVIAISSDDDLSFVLIKNQISHLVYDTRHDLQKDQLNDLRKTSGVKIVVIDTPEDTRIAADTVIYPPVIQIKSWSWEGFTGKIYTGWDYVMLRKAFVDSISKNPKKRTGRILLGFGSTDPSGFTEVVLERLAASDSWKEEYEFVLVCGPQFNRIEAIRQSKVFNQLNITICQAPAEIADVYREVDFAIIAFGVTAYELTAVDVPFLYISLSPDHAASASIFEQEGYGISLGIGNPSTQVFESAIEEMLAKQNHIFKRGVAQPIKKHQICNWDKIINAIIE